MQFEATAELRSKILKQVVVEHLGAEFWATWCRPRKAQVSAPCLGLTRLSLTFTNLMWMCADLQAVQEEGAKQFADPSDCDGQGSQQAVLQRAGRNIGSALPLPAGQLPALAWLLHHY